MKKLNRKCFQKSAWRFNQLVKNKYRKHGDHRVVLMKDETWRRWNELKKLLNLDSNCKLAELLIDSWYGRQLEYGHSEVKSNSLKVNSNYIDLYSTSSHEADFHEIKTELDSENTGNEPEHENLDDGNRLAGTNIDTGTASTVNGEKCGERASTRLKEKGVRPNYNNLADLNYDFESDSNEKLNQTVRDGKRSNSRTENDRKSEVKIQRLLVHDINKSTMKTSKRKKKLSQDPDILINELDNDTSETKNDDVDKMSDIRSIVKKIRSRKSTTDNNDFEIKEVKKLKKLSREKSYNCIIEEPEQKPWINIKLEDHPEKYRIETVGSFERKNRGSNIVDELYTCLLCGRFKSSGKQIFESHIEKHVNGVLQCPQCSYSGRSEVEIANHQAEHGHLSNGRKYVCDLCGVVLYSSDSRLSHMGRVHDDPRFKCKYCDIKSTTRLKRLQHIRSKHPDIAQHCSICKRDFRKSTSVQFKAHISTCKPGYTCQVCGHVFSSKTGLSNHIKHTHMNIRKYQCHMCQYAGKSAKRLKEHIMTHTGSHPYSCDQCSFTCVQSYQLTSHQRTHTGDKPYKCTQCNYAAAWNVQLKDHVKVHSMNTSVLCEPCNILFKNDKAKKMHEKKDH